jgi:metal-dependent amidase/aminoacylase/carboxypeptidase family protein
MLDITNESKALEVELIKLRRALHAVPESGGQIPLTRQIVCDSWTS